MSESQSACCARLCACRLAVAAAIVWGLGVLALGIGTIYRPTYGRAMVEVLGSVYWGFEAGTWRGALIGMGWAAVDGFIGTLVLVGLYNLMLGCGGCCCSCRQTTPPTGGASGE